MLPTLLRAKIIFKDLTPSLFPTLKNIQTKLLYLNEIHTLFYKHFFCITSHLMRKWLSTPTRMGKCTFRVGSKGAFLLCMMSVSSSLAGQKQQV
jgi:hypothetical protein